MLLSIRLFVELERSGGVSFDPFGIVVAKTEIVVSHRVALSRRGFVELNCSLGIARDPRPLVVAPVRKLLQNKRRTLRS